MKSPKKVAVPGDLDFGRYPKREDAVMRLDDSVFLYGTTPVYGKLNLDDPEKIALTTVENSTKTMKITGYNDEQINFNNLDPGFFEFGSELYYVSRTPARKQKQGVSPTNVIGRMYNKSTGNFVATSIPWQLLLSKPFAASLTGTYRPAYESFKIHKDSLVPVAVSNRLALAGGKVFFDLTSIGTVDSSKSNPSIHLKETFMDSLLVMHLAGLGVNTDG